MADYFDKVDQRIAFKVLSQPRESYPPGFLTPDEVERYSDGDGIAYRLRQSWEAEEYARRAVAAITTNERLTELIPRMIEAQERLITLEERREAREIAEHEARINAEEARTSAIWGNAGVVMTIGGAIGSILTAIGSALIGGYFSP